MTTKKKTSPKKNETNNEREYTFTEAQLDYIKYNLYLIVKSVSLLAATQYTKNLEDATALSKDIIKSFEQ